MHGERSSTGLCSCVLISSSLSIVGLIYCPQMIFKTRNHEKIVFKEMYVLKLAIKVAIQAALKEEAKNKDEESGVEDGSVFNR